MPPRCRALRGTDLRERLFQELARAGKILQKFYFEVKVNDKREVFLGPKDLAEELLAGVPLLRQDAAGAAAGVDQQPDGQRQVALLREVPDGLRTAVLVEMEVVFRQVADDLVLLVPHGGEEIDHLHVGGKARLLRLLPAQETGGWEQGQRRKQTRRENFRSHPILFNTDAAGRQTVT